MFPWYLENESYVYLYYILLNQTLFSTTFIGPIAFGGRALFALVLQSAEPDSYLSVF
jgi:hypothetical protein